MRNMLQSVHLRFVLFVSLFLSFGMAAAAPSYKTAAVPLQVAKQRATVAEQWFKIADDKLKQAEVWLQNKGDGKNSPSLAEFTLRRTAVAAELEEIKLTRLESSDQTQILHGVIKRLQDRLQAQGYEHITAEENRLRLTALQKQIQLQQRLLTAEKHRDERLAQTALILKRYRNKLDVLIERALKADQLKQHQQLQQTYHKRQVSIQREQQVWLKKLSAQQVQLKNSDATDSQASTSSWDDAHWQSQFSMEKVNYYQLQLSLLNLQYNQQRLSATDIKSSSIANLNKMDAQIQNMILRIQKLDHLLQRKRKLVHERSQLLQAHRKSIAEPNPKLAVLASKFKSLDGEYLKLQQGNAIVLGYLAEFRQKLQRVYSVLRSERSVLTLLKWETWQQIIHALWMLPFLLAKSLATLRQQIALTLFQLPWYESVAVWMSTLFWWPIGRLIKQLLNTLLGEGSAAATARDPWRILLELVRRNLTSLIVVSAALTFLFLSSTLFQSYSLFFYIAIAWIGTRMAINLSRILLLETETVSSGEDVRLYHELKWLFITGAAFVTISILTHHLPAGLDLRLLANRMVMVYLLALGFILFRGRHAVHALLDPHLQERVLYVRRVIKLLVVLLPMVIISNALLGLFGYMELALTISRNEGVLLLVMAAYILLRGLLIDITSWLSNLVIRKLRNGWLWSEALLKPADRIARIVLLLTALYSLMLLYGWGPGTTVYASLWTVIVFPLFFIGNSPFTLLSLIGVVVALLVLAWLGRWVRECAYRWLYAKYRDLGIRHSLAAFTQYVVVIIGAYIALRVLGIDISGLRFILGGLAVGAGFGLRDVANNLISGILLLMERPLKRGDLVSVGGFEGEVTHIGLRAVTVLSWDNMEVLVPNSETFSKAFTNWTRQDSVVRTVISVKIQRMDDPVKVQKLLLDVLHNCPSVVSDPEPQVFLKEINESLIEFEVRYYINLQLSRSRPIVRSEVLFSIWRCFDEHGIKPPYPQQGVHMHNCHST